VAVGTLRATDLETQGGHRALASRTAWDRFRHHRPAVAAALALLGLVAASLFGPLVVPYEAAIRPDPTAFLAPPSAAHPFGTDEVGRDIVARLIYGGRLSLAVGGLAMAVGITIGTALGALAGFYRGVLDGLVMRLTDVLLSLPQLFVLIVLASVLGPSPTTLILAIGGLSWMEVARMVRVSFLSFAEREFVTAARCAGAADARLVVRHILPNIVGLILVAATLGVGRAMLTEAAVSYLGMGIQLPQPSWGNMLLNAQSYFTEAPWAAILPGFLILVAVLAVNTLGNGLRDAFDPRI
jgi:peptide/nickel transport system permease protein